MAMIREISITTILLLLLLKVFPPWADTWSDGSLIIKLFNFGKVSSRGFNVTNLDFFVASTIDCHQFYIFNETEERERNFHKFNAFNETEWIDVTMDYKVVISAIKSAARNKNPTTTPRSTTESYNYTRSTTRNTTESYNYWELIDSAWKELNLQLDITRSTTIRTTRSTTRRTTTTTPRCRNIYPLIQSSIRNNCRRQKRDATIPSIKKEQLKLFTTVNATIAGQPRTLVQCKKDYSGWAMAAMVPLLVSLIFTLVVWWREERGRTKLLLLPIVFLGLYSQYRAVKIILIGLGKWPKREREEWLEEKGKFTREMVSIEPTTEALPMMLIQVALLTTEVPALFYSNRPSPLLEYPVFFPATFSITLLLTVLGLVHFLKDGPSPLISCEGNMDGFLSKKFGALFCSILLWFSAKCLVLMGVIYNYAAYSTGHNITSVAGIELGKHIFSLMMLWMSTLVLPQLLHAMIVLAWSMRSNIFSLCLSFPSFLITPLFTPFTYKASSTDDGKYQLQVSTKQSMINTFLTIVLTPLTMALYYTDYIWHQTYNFGPNSEQLHENSAEYTLKVTEFVQFKVLLTVIMPIILLLLSIIPTFYVFGYSFTCKHGIQRTGVPRNLTRYEKVGRLRWETKKMAEFPKGSKLGNKVIIFTNEVQETYGMPDIDEDNLEAKLDALHEDFAFDEDTSYLDDAISAPSAPSKGL